MKSIAITGFLGQDPRLRAVQNGDPVLNLSVGVQDRRKSKSGEWENATIWIDVTLFGKRAEALSRILRKGMRVGAHGELSVREYDARDGTTRQQLECIARDVEPLEKLDHAGAQPARGAPRTTHRDDFDGSRRRPPPEARFAEDLPDDATAGVDDDIPF